LEPKWLPVRVKKTRQNMKTEPKDAFIENGFGATSMDDVARRAGTTKRTVYNNFGSKERLLEAVIDHSILLFETAVPPLGPEADCKLSLHYSILKLTS
jgi:AcrR family transcriptional regulator